MIEIRKIFNDGPPKQTKPFPVIRPNQIKISKQIFIRTNSREKIVMISYFKDIEEGFMVITFYLLRRETDIAYHVG